ncbi:SEL1-like repeat protein [Aquabacter sp. L1I39]|uniref:tetratricopeptide repeat protein n=1 Tax=Aquabacter sp. L1I39 TaxID=2820278 RepID=UPI001AD978B6|nr:SEL1-like repeat protein [Aquabacter sp. L1I39]QTL03273.1 SEL1-like repeat protein [Aquabacter sp. L1I39]
MPFAFMSAWILELTVEAVTMINKLYFTCILAAFLQFGVLPAQGADNGAAQAATATHSCDLLAAHPDDGSRPPGVLGVPFNKVDAPAAIAACRAALNEAPGDPRLTFQLGRALQISATDLHEAATLYAAAAEAGHVVAMRNLGSLYRYGSLYRDGTSIDRDYGKARSWYEKAAASDDVGSLRALGDLYLEGLGVPKDCVKAMTFFERAVMLGDHVVARDLPTLLSYCQKGVPRDFAGAKAWYQWRASEGDAEGMRKLGLLYSRGEGTPQDFAAALEWYEKAAALGDVLAMRWAGTYHSLGKGTPEDDAVALSRWTKAAAAGDAEAMRSIGWMHHYGDGGPIDDGAALEWWTKAAEAGSRNAMLHVAWAYQSGIGTAKDDAKANAWYRKAADARSVAGMKRLDERLRRAGETAEADEWRRKAAEAGDGEAAVKVAASLDAQGNRAAATVLLQKAAPNDRQAQANLAYWDVNAAKAATTAQEAEDFFEIAVVYNDERALIAYGTALAEGKLLPRNPERAVEMLLRTRPLAGEDGRLMLLGQLYDNGKGVAAARDAALAAYHFYADPGFVTFLRNETAHAFANDVTQRSCYYDGSWRNLATSDLPALRAAAQSGQPSAMICLGHLLSDHWGSFLSDELEAAAWYARLYEEFGDVNAAFALAELYRKLKDRAWPFPIGWMEPVARNIANTLGYWRSLDPADHVKASDWFARAAKAGRPDALLAMADLAGTAEERFAWRLRWAEAKTAATVPSWRNETPYIWQPIAIAYLRGVGTAADPVLAARTLMKEVDPDRYSHANNFLITIGPVKDGKAQILATPFEFHRDPFNVGDTVPAAFVEEVVRILKERYGDAAAKISAEKGLSNRRVAGLLGMSYDVLP